MMRQAAMTIINGMKYFLAKKKLYILKVQIDPDVFEKSKFLKQWKDASDISDYNLKMSKSI